MTKTSTHVLSTSRKHIRQGSYWNSVEECCASTVLTAACCHSSHCIPAHKFVSVSVELNQNSQPFTVGVGLWQVCALLSGVQWKTRGVGTLFPYEIIRKTASNSSNAVSIRLQEFPHWIFLFHCRLLTSSANLRVASTSVRSQPYFNVA